MTNNTRRLAPPLPDEWRVMTIDSVAAVSAGGTPSRANSAYWGGNIPWITTAQVTFNTITEAHEFITRLGLSRSAAKLEMPGTLLIALYGQGPTRGRVGILGIEAATNQACAAIRVNSDVSPRFLFYYLVAHYEHLRSLSNRGNQANLNGALVKAFPIAVPPRPEQDAIAEALSDVDGLIAAVDKVVAKQRAIRLAAMQQLLTGKTRLPGFTGKWETKRLGDAASIRNDKVFPAAVTSDTPCVELEHIAQGDAKLLTCSTASESTSVKYTFRVGDVLFGRLRSYLRKFWLADRDGICTTEIWPLTVDPRQAAGGFLLGLVQTDRFIEAASISYGTHMPRADWGVMRAFEVRLPPLDEQYAIAEVLADMKFEIEALERRRDTVEQIKQGMMQQLLTGRIRLVKPESPTATTQVEHGAKASKPHTWAFNEAVVISTLAKHFGSDQFPLGRKRYTKLSYLLHRHAERRAEGYLKKAAGPYNPQTRYGGPERIALTNGYIREHKRGPYSGFVAADKIAEAERYFGEWYGGDCIRWLDQFRRRTNDDLEVLTTVDMAAEELRAGRKAVNVDSVKEVIRTHPEWRAKLNRPEFSDANIAKAIEASCGLFGVEVEC